MKLKKLLALSLVLLTVAGTAACAGTDQPAKETTPSSETAAPSATEPGTLPETAPETEPVPERVTYKHVIIIGIDGAGNFHQKCNTPNMDEIFLGNGAWTDYCRASTPSISAQCWGSMLLGVKPSVHKLTNDIIGAQEYKNAEYPTIFKLVREAHPDAELGSFCNWYPISEGIVERDLKVTKERGEDDVLTGKICSYINLKKPELLFIQFDSVDHAGHSATYGSNTYLKALETVDGYVGKIYSAIESAGILDDTLLIITADHGGLGTSHGGPSDDEMNTFFGAVGKSVNPTSDLTMTGRDLASIVCWALGVEGNEKWDSYIPANLFTDNMTPPARPADEIADHKTEPTPAEGTEGALANFIDVSKLRAGLFFDDKLTDLVGEEEVKTVGTVYYPEGYYGTSLRVSSEGYLSFPRLKFEKDSFTVSFWLKVDDGVSGDPAIFSNKNWDLGYNKGIVYCYNGASKFNAGNGSNVRDDYDYYEPEDFTAWNHVTMVVDRDEGTVRVYTNFAETACNTISAGLKNVSFDSGLALNFGQDGTGRYKCPLSAQFDDLLIFDSALSADEIARLGEYYLK